MKSPMVKNQEKYLNLPDGRVLAYSEGGNPDSKIIVIWYHGIFTVGDATRPSPALLKHGVHFISPTLPGWGNSSPRLNPENTPYYITLAQYTTALLEHLHPGCASAPAGEYKIYVSGGSLGTVFAQMIFNASEEVFPPARHIIACFIGAPMTPFRLHRGYAKDLTLGNYFGVGPPTQLVPWRLIQRLASVVISRKLKSVEDADTFLRSLIFDHLEEDEKSLFEKWRKERGLEEGELEKEMATLMVKSVEKSWEGFMEVADTIPSDWGFELENIQKKPIVITTSKGDKMAPGAWAKWLAEKYPGARLKEVDGGHIASLWSIDSTWEELLNIES